MGINRAEILKRIEKQVVNGEISNENLIISIKNEEANELLKELMEF